MGFGFHIFYCNSSGVSRAVRYNGVFVIAGFVSGVCFHIFYCNYVGFQMLFVIMGSSL